MQNTEGRWFFYSVGDTCSTTSQCSPSIIFLQVTKILLHIINSDIKYTAHT